MFSIVYKKLLEMAKKWHMQSSKRLFHRSVKSGMVKVDAALEREAGKEHLSDA